METLLRWLLTAILVPIIAFFSYGFLASGEFRPQEGNAFRLVYGTIIIVCVAALVAVWRVKRKRR
jgi:uncharacterized membrane protein